MKQIKNSRRELLVGAAGLGFVSLTGAASAQSEEGSDGSGETCDGAPKMSRTSITTPQGRITNEKAATVEANFRVDPIVPEDCPVNIDLQYSFSQSGFQFGGGSGWEQSATDIVATTFSNLQSGEIRSIDAQIYTNGAEPGDQITIVADYEIWYEGNREESVQQSGIRKTVDVEAVNEPENSSKNESESSLADQTPGFGVTGSLVALSGVGYGIKRLTNKDGNEP